MNKQRSAPTPPASPDNTISMIGPGMTISGDCKSEGTIRIEGRVEGNVEAAKAIVIGKEGSVVGDITTQDAVISGKIHGSLTIASRLELQASCDVKGEIDTGRIVLEEGATVNGTVKMGSRGSRPTSPPS
jgi:cytoskeletal protein CcmA (bactofilin family)